MPSCEEKRGNALEAEALSKAIQREEILNVELEKTHSLQVAQEFVDFVAKGLWRRDCRVGGRVAAGCPMRIWLRAFRPFRESR
ncbi:hypothetical protein N7535_003733 [Penicillium sp. DV-2018c]|nr:hypothetical protein N7461_000566 [Penicillium sp. DV-2018c]KAJ5576807.1 hypothetical protein N7535_003733 [Penicillium sp. DV-2018c]